MMQGDVDDDKTRKCKVCGGTMEEQFDPFTNKCFWQCLRCKNWIISVELIR